MYYLTELDGMRKIEVNTINTGQYVKVLDKLFDEENLLFKAKNVKEKELQMVLVKTIEVNILNSEEQEGYKKNQLYIFGDNVFVTENKLNKNQIILLRRKFYDVVEIQKQSQEANLINLQEIDVINAVNTYTVFRNKKEANPCEKEVILETSSYYEAILLVANNRAKKDDYFYHL